MTFMFGLSLRTLLSDLKGTWYPLQFSEELFTLHSFMQQLKESLHFPLSARQQTYMWNTLRGQCGRSHAIFSDDEPCNTIGKEMEETAVDLFFFSSLLLFLCRFIERGETSNQIRASEGRRNGTFCVF